MGSSALMILAMALLAASLLLAYLGRRSKPIAVTLGGLVLGFVLLGAMFFAANRFTGHGIDQAVLYHVTYGLDGAGFSEYAPLILGVIGLVYHRRLPDFALLAAAIGCAMLYLIVAGGRVLFAGIDASFDTPIPYLAMLGLMIAWVVGLIAGTARLLARLRQTMGGAHD